MKQSAALGAAPNPQDLKTHINFNTQYNIIYIYSYICAILCDIIYSRVCSMPYSQDV